MVIHDLDDLGSHHVRRTPQSSIYIHKNGNNLNQSSSWFGGFKHGVHFPCKSNWFRSFFCFDFWLYRIWRALASHLYPMNLNGFEQACETFNITVMVATQNTPNDLKIRNTIPDRIFCTFTFSADWGWFISPSPTQGPVGWIDQVSCWSISFSSMPATLIGDVMPWACAGADRDVVLIKRDRAVPLAGGQRHLLKRVELKNVGTF